MPKYLAYDIMTECICLVINELLEILIMLLPLSITYK